jgi:hypothetical protein
MIRSTFITIRHLFYCCYSAMLLQVPAHPTKSQSWNMERTPHCSLRCVAVHLRCIAVPPAPAVISLGRPRRIVTDSQPVLLLPGLLLCGWELYGVACRAEALTMYRSSSWGCAIPSGCRLWLSISAILLLPAYVVLSIQSIHELKEGVYTSSWSLPLTILPLASPTALLWTSLAWPCRRCFIYFYLVSDRITE